LLLQEAAVEDLTEAAEAELADFVAHLIQPAVVEHLKLLLHY
jgi:hypothetical protein